MILTPKSSMGLVTSRGWTLFPHFKFSAKFLAGLQVTLQKWQKVKNCLLSYVETNCNWKSRAASVGVVTLNWAIPTSSEQKCPEVLPSWCCK